MYGGRIPISRQKRILNYVTCYIYIKGITSQILPNGSPLLDEKLRLCGKRTYVWTCFNCNYQMTITLFCGIRVCRNPGCIAARERKTVEKYYEYVAGMMSPWFMTVTLRGHHELSFGPKSRLDKAFNSLVRYYKAQKDPSGRPIWRGYIKALELEPKEDGFFYHLHIIYDGVKLSKSVLSKKWAEYTKDSMVVDVRPISSRDEAVAYVVKYCTKSVNLPISFMEYRRIRKMRFLSSHGCKRVFKRERTACPSCGV